MTWTVIAVMATVSISFLHKKCGVDVSSLFSGRKKEKCEVYLSVWKTKYSKWDIFCMPENFRLAFISGDMER